MMVCLVDNQHLDDAFSFVQSCIDRCQTVDHDKKVNCYYQAVGCLKLLESLDLLPTQKKITFLSQLDFIKF